MQNIKNVLFKDLAGFMTSGPVVVQVLRAIMRLLGTDLMGATNPKEAAEGQFVQTLKYRCQRCPRF